jgi:hypothetical protein
MNVTITMPSEMERKLKRKAEKEHRPLEQVIVDLLAEALAMENAFPSPEDIVARIQATPPNPGSVRPATGSLADALRNAPEDPDFDLATWNQAWTTVETELRAITRVNAATEGRA